MGDFLRGGRGDRRDFLRETLGKLAREAARSAERKVVKHRFFRPPGAVSEIEFLAACTRCNECIEVCPVDAIVKAPNRAGLAAGTPVINPQLQPCAVCDDIPCAAACPTGALLMPDRGWAGYRIGWLELDPERCIAFDGVQCGVCVPVCPVGDSAIELDDRGRPMIKVEGCVGCGECVRACVTRPSSLLLYREEH